MTAASEFTFLIDVPVNNRWQNIELLRSSVQSCLSAVLADVNGRDALAMVTGELLENAVKYGHWTDSGGAFRLRVWGDHEGGHIEVENPVGPDDPGPQHVRDHLALLASYPSPEEAYQALILKVAMSPRGVSGGLGLARVAYEGGCTLRMALDGTTLRVGADLPFGVRPEGSAGGS